MSNNDDKEPPGELHADFQPTPPAYSSSVYPNGMVFDNSNASAPQYSPVPTTSLPPYATHPGTVPPPPPHEEEESMFIPTATAENVAMLTNENGDMVHPKTIAEILKLAWHISVGHFSKFIMIIAPMLVIMFIVSIFLALALVALIFTAMNTSSNPAFAVPEGTQMEDYGYLMMNYFTELGFESIALFVGFVGVFIIYLILQCLISVFFMGALYNSISSAYNKNPISFNEAMRFGKQCYGRLLGTYVLLYLAVFGGFLMLIIPGILFGIWFFLAPVVAALDPTVTTCHTLSTSRQLVRGHFLRTVGFAFICILVSFFASIPQYIIPGLIGSFLTFAFSLFGMVYVSVAQVVFYYDMLQRTNLSIAMSAIQLN